MIKYILLATAIASPAWAQMPHAGEMGQMQGMSPGSPMAGMNGAEGMEAGGSGGMEMQYMPGMMEMMGGMMKMMQSMNDKPAGIAGSPLSEPGQSAFAAIAEVVRQLESDPQTDWSKVNIDALRQHLRDMDVVMIDSGVLTEELERGLRFRITGGPDAAPSITRMVLAHAGIMDGVEQWRYTARELDNGAILEVQVPEGDLAKLKGLGFYGLLASGMHHQPHHWAIANGSGMGG